MRFLKRQIVGVSLALAAVRAGGVPAHGLTVGEGLTAPLGFHDATPAFSWKLPEGTVRQTAYRIEARSERGVWDSGWVASDRSVGISYGGPPLDSRQRVEWRIDFRDENGRGAGWSAPACFELGLLSSKDWVARWIRPKTSNDPKTEGVSWLRRRFPLSERNQIARARLYATARGCFVLRLNGTRVGDDELAPGWTSYRHRIDTLTYDVTRLLQPGKNLLEAMLGMGRYGGRYGWSGRPRGFYGLDPELLLQLEVTYRDGTSETVVSDGRWEGTLDGPILSSSIFDGEVYDARRAAMGWAPVTVGADLGTARLTPKPFPSVRVVRTLEARSVAEPEPGRFVFDFGQNMVGRPRLRMPVGENQTVTLRFAEMLNTNGTLYTANYRTAKSIAVYTAAEAGRIDWQPVFTFYGFRYVELSGLPGGVRPERDWVTGMVLHSDLKRAGTFESSHAKLNRLQSNIVWGQRGNFVDIPTDCPQRDERLGWTGDAQVFEPTSMFNYDCHAFWKSWLGSMRDDQMPDGRIPHVVPDVLGGAGSPGWMDAATFIPWDLYVRTGDAELLADNFEMMERLVGWYRGQSKDHLTPGIKGFGDWLQPHAKGAKGDTPSALLGVVFYARSARILSDSARVLGRTEEAERYAAEADAVSQAFTKYYFDADGRLKNALETQTAYVLALAFDLTPPEMRPRLASHLVRLVREADGHLRTGFLGTPHIVSVLDRTGHADLALDLLFKETYPSWLYSVNQGATTMWERWNSYSHEEGFGDAGMNSFNHYAYGAIGQWMVERLAGLAPDPSTPGYKHFFVRPLIGGPLDFVRAELETPYGRAASGWARGENGGVELVLTVPPNSAATVEFPDGRPPERVAAGTYRFQLDGAREKK